MALHFDTTKPEKPGDDSEQVVAALLREAEMVARGAQYADGRESRLAAIREQVAAYGGDPAAVPGARKPAAENRATRESKPAAARSKRGGGRPKKAAEADD